MKNNSKLQDIFKDNDLVKDKGRWTKVNHWLLIDQHCGQQQQAKLFYMTFPAFSSLPLHLPSPNTAYRSRPYTVTLSLCCDTECCISYERCCPPGSAHSTYRTQDKDKTYLGNYFTSYGRCINLGNPDLSFSSCLVYQS